MTTDSTLKSPLFLIGNVRSGTSMLQNFVGQHPDLAVWFEPRTVWVYAAPGRQHDRFEASDATPRVIRYIRGRFLNFQEKAGGKRILEKTPSNVLRIPYVHRIFPTSRFVYVLRHPLDQISSSEIQWQTSIGWGKFVYRLMETPTTQLHYYLPRLFGDLFRKRVLRRKHVGVWGVRYPDIHDDVGKFSVEEINAKQWVECSRQARRDLEQIDPDLYIVVKYEDLLQDPDRTYGKICSHFSIDFSPEIQTMVRTQTRANQEGAWQRLPKETIIRCLNILQDEMQTCGYSPPTHEELDTIDIHARWSAEQRSRNTSQGHVGIE